jgi:DNA-binding MarR family transcriptional regulator
MKSLEFLQTLLPDITVYVEQSGAPSAEGFADFIKNKQKIVQVPSDAESAIALMKGYDNTSASIAFHVARLGKYAKYYVKDALKHTPLLGMDDFGFLASVVENGELNKSALIAYNVAEVPTGMDIIKRLIKNELLEEVVNQADRREKLVHATDLGKRVFFSATLGMAKVGGVVCGNLNEVEKKELLALLERLDHFHEKIYRENKQYDIDAITANYF